MMDPRAEAERWLVQASIDLDDAKYLAEGRRYSLACFSSQQAAEKAVKAFLYARGAETVFGHSVGDLCARAEALDKRFGEYGLDAAFLDRFYVPTRYPNGLPGGIPGRAFRAKDAKETLAAASRILALSRKAMERASE